MQEKQHGFTLIELMIVVAIIGLLASMAIPAYQSYTIRAQISEGLSMTAPLKTALAEYYTNHGSFPSDNTEASVEAPAGYSGAYVTAITVNGAAIEVTYGNNANTAIAGQVVTVTGAANAGSMQWSCSAAAIPDGLLPSVCR